MGVESIKYEQRDLPLTNRVTVNEADVAAVKVGTATKTISTHTSSYQVLVSETGTIFNNRGATGTITFTLPVTPAMGLVFTFVEQMGQVMRIDPGTATIRDASGFTPDKYKWCDSGGDSMTLLSDSGGNWFSMNRYGDWFEQA